MMPYMMDTSGAFGGYINLPFLDLHLTMQPQEDSWGANHIASWHWHQE